MFALVDANSFYASAEEVFDPSIRGKPIVVLTNNDGCICAMSHAAKVSGVDKFVPYHTVERELKQINAVIRSSNYALYADLSKRVFEVTSRFAEQHIYSVDEVFLKFPQSLNQGQQWYDIAGDIRHSVWRETRIPVGVGMACTPTLAKVASYAGKRLREFDGIAVLDHEATIQRILGQMKVTSVWGVGKRIGKRLNEMGIETASELANRPPKQIRQQFSVELERTVRELNGEVCFQWDKVRKPKQQIYASRSFGTKVTCPIAMNQSLATHAERVGRKLRQQDSLVKSLSVFAHSNPFATDYYKKTIVHEFTEPTNDDRKLVAAATQAGDQLYKAGVRFQKSGVGAIELVDSDAIQTDMFATPNTRKNVMACLDAINAKFGNQSLVLASRGFDQSQWSMNRNFLSPEFTTRWQDIPVFNC